MCPFFLEFHFSDLTCESSCPGTNFNSVKSLPGPQVYIIPCYVNCFQNFPILVYIILRYVNRYAQDGRPMAAVKSCAAAAANKLGAGSCQILKIFKFYAIIYIESEEEIPRIFQKKKF